MFYTLPPLPYAYDALEPHIDARTMEIHHNKHHQAYVDNLNAALLKHPAVAEIPLYELLSNIEQVPHDIRTAVQNHGGGHYNHTFFWAIMSPNGGGEPKGRLAEAINKKFGSFDAFKEQFNTAAKGVFGSGWAWLGIDKTGQLVIMAMPNQNAPLMVGLKPILGLDVWEHAYYLKYQNKRPDYIGAWWNVVDWEQVGEHYELITR
jgi:Fe-Mn family superoxide dismutase